MLVLCTCLFISPPAALMSTIASMRIMHYIQKERESQTSLPTIEVSRGKLVKCQFNGHSICTPQFTSSLNKFIFAFNFFFYFNGVALDEEIDIFHRSRDD